MLNEVNNFIYEMESIYLKELNPHIVLNFIEKFYNDFIKTNKEMDSALLHKVAGAIIVCTDTIMLKKSQIKEQWIHKTCENFILKQNRGNEIFDTLVQDITSGYVFNRDVIRIVQIFFLLGIDSDYKTQFMDLVTQQSPVTMNVEDNIIISNLNKLKKPVYRYLHISILITVMAVLITELFCFISLNTIVKSTEGILNNIRSIYVS